MTDFVSIRVSSNVKEKILHLKGKLQSQNIKKNITISETIKYLIEVYDNGRSKSIAKRGKNK